MNNSVSRNTTYDFLKCIGLSAIILAHSGPPDEIRMVRSFDVPLMVILSALLGSMSYRRYVAINPNTGGGYIVSRIKRLAFPTWLFLTLYFPLRIIITGQPESPEFYLYSYCLTTYGSGFVWVILVYIYVAMLVPLYNRMRFTAKSAILVALAYILYELALHYNIGIQSKIIETAIYIIPYGVLAFLGYHNNSMGKGTRRMIALTSAIIFVFFAVYYRVVNGAFQLTESVKFPPRLYYLSYGVACSFALLMLCEAKPLKCFGSPVIRYISTHSMWIYLWHILWVKAWDAIGLPPIWYVKLLFVYAGAVLTVIVVNIILDFVEKRWKLPIIKYFRG